jgi:hypothetical protein
MRHLAAKETYKVVAVEPSGATKVVAVNIGAFKATRLAAEIEARGLQAQVTAQGWWHAHNRARA